MKKILLFFIFFKISLFASSRHDEDQKSKIFFKNLNLYQDHRGINLPPGVTAYYDQLKKLGLTEKKIINNKWGFIAIEQEIQGFFNLKDEGHSVGVLGCVGCHSGKAAGHYFIGLGNKNIDPHQIGKDLNTFQKIWKRRKASFLKSETYKTIENNANNFAKKMSRTDIANQSQGLVATALIRTWFYEQAGLEMDFLNPAAVKVPHLWGYGAKRKVGSFVDGYGDGNYPGWFASVEMAAGQTPEAAHKYEKKLYEIQNHLENFLPPKYPFSINHTLADKGKIHYQNHCQRCHGTYTKDLNNLPIFEAPKLIPIEIIQTDSDRLAISDLFNELVDNNPFNHLIKRNKVKPGYFAQRLEGVWSRFPYLHNGSVPNIYELMSHPSKRSVNFSLKDAGELYRFDSKKLGLTTNQSFYNSKPKRWIYDTSLIGQSNQGHYWDSFSKLQEIDKLELIEYLKTL